MSLSPIWREMARGRLEEKEANEANIRSGCRLSHPRVEFCYKCCLHPPSFIVTIRDQGDVTCTRCGTSIPGSIVWETSVQAAYDHLALPWGAKGTYQPRHHVAERLSQLQCQEPQPPLEFRLACREFFRENKKIKPVKKGIRKCIKSLRGRFPNARKYVENWISLRYFVLECNPVELDVVKINKVKEWFPMLRMVWECVRPPSRKCSINYNFLFVRMFQLLDAPEFYPFFPLMKRSKNDKLDIWWTQMCLIAKLPLLPLPPRRLFKLPTPPATGAVPPALKVAVRKKRAFGGIKKCTIKK